MKHQTLSDAVTDFMELSDNAAILDIGCRNAGWLLCFENQFKSKIKKSIGVDKNSKGFTDFDLEGTSISLMEMDCSQNIDFPNETFDFVFSKDALECFADKKTLVREIHRILKPNGTVICVHADWDSIVYNGSNKDLINKAVHAYANWQQPWMDDFDSWIGRRTYPIFHSSGLFESRIAVYNCIETEFTQDSYGYSMIDHFECLVLHETGLLSREEYDCLKNDLLTSYQQGQYLFSKPFYIYKGIKKDF